MQLSPLEIKDKLLKALDKEYNVVDMATVVEIISILERTPITKEALESTRLGKFINELRRKTTIESLAKRAKDLVRRWRNLISKPPESNSQTSNHTNGSNFSRYTPICSPSIRPSPISPSLRSNPLSPRVGSALTSPALSSTYLGSRSRSVLSPPISVHSEKSSSPILNYQQSSTIRNLSSSKRSNSNIKNNIFRSKTTDQAAINSGLHVTDSVPKTHASNKRLRKDSDGDDINEPLGKMLRLNGMRSANSTIEVFGECSRDSFGVISDKSESVVEIPITRDHTPSEPPVPESDIKLPKKRGRKKGSTKQALIAAKNQAKSNDMIKKQIASIARTPKVKTTQELLAGLQAKTSGKQEITATTSEMSPSLQNSVITPRGTALDALEMSWNKTEHIAKFLRSQSELETSDIDTHYAEDRSSNLGGLKTSVTSKDCVSELRSVSRLEDEAVDSRDAFDSASQSIVNVISTTPFQSVEEILSRLPAIPPLDEIHWSSSDCGSEDMKVKSVNDVDIERLKMEHLPGVNGVFNDGLVGDENDSGFREWHECVSKSSYQGELLHILPYVVID